MEKVFFVMSILFAFTSISMLNQMDLFSLLGSFRTSHKPMKDLWQHFIRYFIPFFWGRVSMIAVLSEIWRMFFFFLLWVWGNKENIFDVKEFDAFASQSNSYLYFFTSLYIIGLIVPAFLIQKQNER